MNPHWKWPALSCGLALAGMLVSACKKDQNQIGLDELRGEWRVLSTTLTAVNGGITTQQVGLGNLAFESCNYKKSGSCVGYHHLATGDSIKFQFVPASDENPRVGLSFLSPSPDTDWSGTYGIQRTGDELVLSCEQCVAASGGNFRIVLLRK